MPTREGARRVREQRRVQAHRARARSSPPDLPGGAHGAPGDGVGAGTPPRVASRGTLRAPRVPGDGGYLGGYVAPLSAAAVSSMPSLPASSAGWVAQRGAGSGGAGSARGSGSARRGAGMLVESGGGSSGSGAGAAAAGRGAGAARHHAQQPSFFGPSSRSDDDIVAPSRRAGAAAGASASPPPPLLAAAARSPPGAPDTPSPPSAVRPVVQVQSGLKRRLFDGSQSARSARAPARKRARSSPGRLNRSPSSSSSSSSSSSARAARMDASVGASASGSLHSARPSAPRCYGAAGGGGGGGDGDDGDDDDDGDDGDDDDDGDGGGGGGNERPCMDDYGDNGDDSIALGQPELQVGEEPPEDGEDGEEPPDERGGGDGDGDEEGGGGDAARLSPSPSPADGGGAGAASAVASSTDCAICSVRGAAAARRGDARSDCTVQCEIAACSKWFHPTCLPSQAELRTAKNAIIKKLPYGSATAIYSIICNIIIERILLPQPQHAHGHVETCVRAYIHDRCTHACMQTYTTKKPAKKPPRLASAPQVCLLIASQKLCGRCYVVWGSSRGLASGAPGSCYIGLYIDSLIMI